MLDRPYRELTVEEIKNRLVRIEREVEELKGQFMVSAPTTADLEDFRTRFLPELQRLGGEQSELSREMSLRSRASD